MITPIQDNFTEIISKIKFIQADVEKNYNEWSCKRNNLIEEIGHLEAKRQQMLDENKNRLESTSNLETQLKQKELELNQRQMQVERMEADLKKEIEEERKVSIMKNIHQQLKEKTNENELLNRQISFYKKNNDLFSQLISKLGLNSDKLTVDTIIQTVLEKEKQPVPVVVVEEPLLPLELEVDEEEEEGVVVEDFEYRGKLYYIDNQSGDIYSRLANDEVGDVVGSRDKNGKVRISQKK
jgi:hypothetical protein